LGQAIVFYYLPPLYATPAQVVSIPAAQQALLPEDREWLVIAPRQRRAEILPPPVPAAPKAMDVPARDLRPPKREPPPLPGPAPAATDPKVEAARQMRLGNEALTTGDYARAERRFQGAAAVSPEPLALFLLAQARFALGKYQEAVAAIQAGMHLQTDWPAAPFRPRELYGENRADYPVHLRQLADALARHPEDPFLLFLYAYQLWFDDRRDEARPIFGRARAVAPDPSLSERFLQGK
jgi:hypothetical protein